MNLSHTVITTKITSCNNVPWTLSTACSSAWSLQDFGGWLYTYSCEVTKTLLSGFNTQSAVVGVTVPSTSTIFFHGSYMWDAIVEIISTPDNQQCPGNILIS